MYSMQSPEHLTPKQELIANFEQRAKDSFSFRLLWQYYKLSGGKHALESLPESGALHDYSKATLAMFNLQVESDLPEWLQSETGQGILIYGPHTFRLEPFILSHLLSRREIYFVAISRSLFMLPEKFQDMVLPVTPSYLAKDARKRSGVAGINQRIRQSMFTNDDMRTVAEMKQANLAVSQKAAELLRAGKVVVIFPSSARDMYSSRWNNGIGQIVSYLDPEIDNVLLQPYDMTQISIRTAMRNMRRKYVLHQNEEPTQIDVTWKPPLTVAEVYTDTQINNPEPSEIAELLAQNYKSPDGLYLSSN